MSVHLDTLFFSVCIVGFAGTPVHIRHRRQIDPPEHRNSSVMPDNTLKTHMWKQTLLFKAYKYSPPATPNILIPIQAAAAWPVPTWKQHTIRPMLSQITIHPSLMCRLTRTQVICEEVPPKNHWSNTQKPGAFVPGWPRKTARLHQRWTPDELSPRNTSQGPCESPRYLCHYSNNRCRCSSSSQGSIRTQELKKNNINKCTNSDPACAICSEFRKVITLSFLNFSAQSPST